MAITPHGTARRYLHQHDWAQRAWRRGLTSINQRRDILGQYRNADGVTHGFLLTGFQPACVASN